MFEYKCGRSGRDKSVVSVLSFVVVVEGGCGL